MRVRNIHMAGSKIALRAHARKANPALRHRAEIGRLLYPSKEVLGIRSYTIIRFVNILIKKSLQERMHTEKARKLETTSDKHVYNTILLILRT